MNISVDASWLPLIGRESEKEYFRALSRFLDSERRGCDVYPSDSDLFSVFRLTPFDAVKVVILGQDPYHGQGQAHGLCFSVPSSVSCPPSLVNILKELHADTGCAVPEKGDLTEWARRGVFLLNTILSVRAGEAASHKGKGWELFTDAVIRELSKEREFLVFILWGAHAQKKADLIDSRHCILASAHPSPLSVYRGFSGSRPFSRANDALQSHGIAPVDWKL
ncbi:MAG: uracil-DNA glycosylase [Spirochaetota bacterium]